MSDHRERPHSPRHTSNAHKDELRHSHRHRHHDRRSRSRSPKRDGHSRRHNQDERRNQPSKSLPLNAHPISKYDLSAYRPLFTLYLDIQKHLEIDDLPEDEVRGRWKSFVKKWNNGDLAEGWYDAQTFEKAKRGTFGIKGDGDHSSADTKNNNRPVSTRPHGQNEDEDIDNDDFGPNLPTMEASTSSSKTTSAKPGPAIPSSSDLRLRNEQAREDADTLRSSEQRQRRSERKAEYKDQTDRLNELVPRAEAGTRERQLEKKQEVTASNRAFAAAKDVGGDVELRDTDVMGDEDSLGELKRMKEMEQRKRTEREIRREEILRTRAAEREERVKGLKEKEAKTMEMLKNIARARFGDGDGADGG